MNPAERYYKICHLLARARYPVPQQRLLEELDISRATLARDIRDLRDRFYAPIKTDRKTGGYYFDPDEPRFELPGIWFSAPEAQALITLNHLLHDMQPGFLEPHLKPVEQRIEKFLERKDQTLSELRRRIRILSMGKRNYRPTYFELISHAVLERKRLFITHYSRERDEQTQRELSPQRLVHYRDNWYLDAYDHMRSGLRTFSLDAIETLRVLDKKARNVPDKRLDLELGDSYGIFAGKKTQLAVLHFNAFRASWVAKEHWHPQQHGELQDDSSYILKIPYSDDRELLMDIMKYGADVEVLAPKNLRARVREMLRQAAKKY